MAAGAIDMDLRELPTGHFKRHPWEVSRVGLFADVLHQEGAITGPTTVLDVGSGDGYFARTLARQLRPGSRVVCSDLNYDPAGLPPEERVGEVPVSFTRQPPVGPFDLLLLLDVVEHVPDDFTFVRALVADHLRPGGFCLISVPAWPRLYTEHDIFLRHYRRYRPETLHTVATRAGLTRVAGGGAFHSLLAPRAAQKLIELTRGRRSHPTDVPPVPGPGEGGTETGSWKGGPRTSALVTGALHADNRLSLWLARHGVQVPGLSVWFLGQRS